MVQKGSEKHKRYAVKSTIPSNVAFKDWTVIAYM